MMQDQLHGYVISPQFGDWIEDAINGVVGIVTTLVKPPTANPATPSVDAQAQAQQQAQLQALAQQNAMLQAQQQASAQQTTTLEYAIGGAALLGLAFLALRK